MGNRENIQAVRGWGKVGRVPFDAIDTHVRSGRHFIIHGISGRELYVEIGKRRISVAAAEDPDNIYVDLQVWNDEETGLRVLVPDYMTKMNEHGERHPDLYAGQIVHRFTTYLLERNDDVQGVSFDWCDDFGVNSYEGCRSDNFDQYIRARRQSLETSLRAGVPAEEAKKRAITAGLHAVWSIQHISLAFGFTYQYYIQEWIDENDEIKEVWGVMTRGPNPTHQNADST